LNILLNPRRQQRLHCHSLEDSAENRTKDLVRMPERVIDSKMNEIRKSIREQKTEID